MEECFDSMTADQLRHVCETQRVEIRRLRLLVGETPRGTGGFGSTDKTLGTANASPKAEPNSAGGKEKEPALRLDPGEPL